MPLIKVEHICSSSSEDTKQPADNLLNLETYKKWSCADPTEKKAVVVLQLEKSTQIHALDLGNNGSAFVEVLVGRSTAPDSFEVLLGMSTFMTVPESKTWTNVNRVRMFGKESFSKDAAAQKWDRVKVLCTQPYNKNEKYGVSFIKLHSPPEASETTPTYMPTPSDSDSKPVPSKLGRFSLKKETTDIPSGSLFFKRKATSPPASPTPNVAAKARMASSAALTSQTPPRNKQPAQSSSRGKSPEDGFGAGGNRKRATPSGRGKSPKAKKSRVSSNNGGGRGEGGGGGGKETSVPFSKLMDGVVFTLSGFKNPFRGQLREKGMEMGALYQGDWGTTCTHLVCAFPNTPKFSQVKGDHGLIVRKEWILDSHVKRKRLPAKQYRLSASEDDASTSEDERYDAREVKIFKRADVGGQGSTAGVAEGKEKAQDTLTGGPRSTVGVAKGEPLHGGAEEEGPVQDQMSAVGVAKEEEGPLVIKGDSMMDVVEEAEEDPYEASTDEEGYSEGEVVKSKPLSATPLDEPSCELEVNGVQRTQPQRDDCYQTDKEPITSTTTTSSKKSLMTLPTFLSDCSCFFYGGLSEVDCKMLTRYIVAYGGEVVNYMSPKVTHVITREKWADNFDQALGENPALSFVRPSWVFTCHQQRRCVPCEPHAVSPML